MELSKDTELDCSNAGRGVWLVKVPKYVARKWYKGRSRFAFWNTFLSIPAKKCLEIAQGDVEVGKLKIVKHPGQKSQVSLSLSDSILSIGDEKIPKEHRFDVQAVTKQTLGVFSQIGNLDDE